MGLPGFSPTGDLHPTLEYSQWATGAAHRGGALGKKSPPFSEFRAPQGNREVNIVRAAVALPSEASVELQAGLSHAT